MFLEHFKTSFCCADKLLKTLYSIFMPNTFQQTFAFLKVMLLAVKGQLNRCPCHWMRKWVSDFLFYSIIFMTNYTCQTDITFAFAHQNIARRVSKWQMTNSFHILHQDTSQRHPFDLWPFCKKKCSHFLSSSPLPSPCLIKLQSQHPASAHLDNQRKIS